MHSCHTLHTMHGLYVFNGEGERESEMNGANVVGLVMLKMLLRAAALYLLSH